MRVCARSQDSFCTITSHVSVPHQSRSSVSKSFIGPPQFLGIARNVLRPKYANDECHIVCLYGSYGFKRGPDCNGSSSQHAWCSTWCLCGYSCGSNPNAATIGSLQIPNSVTRNLHFVEAIRVANLHFVEAIRVARSVRVTCTIPVI